MEGIISPQEIKMARESQAEASRVILNSCGEETSVSFLALPTFHLAKTITVMAYRGISLRGCAGSKNVRNIQFDPMRRLIIVPIACGFAIGVGFAAFSVLQLFETVIEYPPVDGVAQPVRPGVFGLPWDEAAGPLIGLAGTMGAFCVARALTSPSPLWRFDVPFALGLLLLVSALSVTVSALCGSAVSLGDSAHIWPVPMQAAVLTMFGLFALVGACYRDR